MIQRASGGWVIALSLLLAYLLAIVPFPDWAMHYRPQWVALVLIYWLMALPYRVGIGTAWLSGAFLDILQGSLLGINALSFALLAYLTLSLHQRLRLFSALQQSGIVLVLVGLTMTVTNWIKVGTDQTSEGSLLYLLGALSSAFVWPWLFLMMRQLRRGFDVK
ncbi:rod shape-determining protein MreD [Pseudohongiella spirulinae]|uniref:Rod shape-determining protein MreD n=1 Tax=Pseudohongiella spirulinae TaxID=1249552 RepID=A0A0S2KAV0_9GAMM|nr:rod shape-determining protein MreD [Pseudohongiella spirulinae]ALO45447.1 Rod shape-determining protein MreD [Pseudohongiella spirulinae]